MATSHTNLPLRDLTYEDYLAHAEDLEFSDEGYEDFLEHYGVPGMKWGVRKSESSARAARGEARTASKANKASVRAARANLKAGKQQLKSAKTKQDAKAAKATIKAARASRTAAKTAAKTVKSNLKEANTAVREENKQKRAERKEARAERRQERREARAAKRADAQKAKNPASQMSDAQIKERVNRMNLEAQYNRLSKEAYGNTPKGTVENFVKKQGVQLLEKQVQKQANRAIDAGIEKALGAATAKAAKKNVASLNDSPLGAAGKQAVSNAKLDRKVHTYGVGVENRIRTRIQGPQPSYSRVRNPRR